jgi:putative alpha-1,2-mannosidase
MIIYTATKTETKTLDITNVEATNSTVYINNIVFDDVQLAQGTVENPNLRVLELNLNDGDVVSAKDNPLVTYTIV